MRDPVVEALNGVSFLMYVAAIATACIIITITW